MALKITANTQPRTTTINLEKLVSQYLSEGSFSSSIFENKNPSRHVFRGNAAIAYEKMRLTQYITLVNLMAGSVELRLFMTIGCF